MRTPEENIQLAQLLFSDVNETPEEIEKISDGYHTFGELYFHRMKLFSVLCNTHPKVSWKSKLHSDGTMYENHFIVGITTPEEDDSYHYHMDNWEYFKVKELQNAPEWDGHNPEDIGRLDRLEEYNH